MRRRIAAALLATTGLAWALPAAAQDEPPPPEDYGTEIIVTATLRSESLQDIPISVQALGEETLAQQNVASFDDYVKMLPSVSFQSLGPGLSQLNFRGISSGGDGADVASLPATGVYLDNIPVTTIGALVDLHIYDVARVEALSGPQGTLFGASSLSGTLRIITNEPDPSGVKGGFDVQLNKYGKGEMGGQIEGFINIPLSPDAAIRLVGYYSKEGGYIDNTFAERTFTLDDADPTTNLTVDNAELVEDDFNDVEKYGGRAALKVDLDEDWTVKPTFMYQHLKTTGSFLYDPDAGDLELHDFFDQYNEDDWWQAALTIEGKIGNWDLVYAGGYFKRDVENVADYSYYNVVYDTYGYYATYFPDGNGGFLSPMQEQFQHYKFTKHSQELRLASPAENPLRVTLGAFFQRQTNRGDAQYSVEGLGSAALDEIVWFQPIIGDVAFLKRFNRIDKDYALFGQFDYDITDALTLTAGIRGFKVDNTLFGFSGFSYNADNPICLPTDYPGIPCANIYQDGSNPPAPRESKETGETHKVSLSWKIDPDRMIYATYSTGYRPGGINRLQGRGPFKSDTLSNFELGWKTTWVNGRLRWNGALFHEKWDDVQYSLAFPGDNGVTSIANAGKAESTGIETDVLFQSGGLNLSLSGTYLDAKVTTDFCIDEAQTNCAPSGTRLPVQPKFKANASARYTFPVSNSSDAFVQGSMLHQSGARSFLLDSDVATVGYTEAFTTFDFAAGIDFEDFAIEAFIENAFDERGQLSRNTPCAASLCGDFYRIYPVRPQFFGIKFSYRYGE